MPQHLAPKLVNFASILEDKTREQAITTSSMPFIYPHLALMPDAHLGKGATVGSVIPTKGAIMPAAVGVDIGCVDRDSEYLSPTGWRKIGEYDGGLVMQYDPDSTFGSFVQPQRYIVKDAPFFYRLRSKYGVDQMLTPEHKVLAYKITGRDRRREQVILSAEEFVQKDRSLTQGFKAQFPTTFTPMLDTAVDALYSELRVWVMVSADGHIAGPSAVLHFKKERKIERAEKLLADVGADFTRTDSANGTTTIRFRYDRPKGLEHLWGASLSQLGVITDELFFWDGNERDKVFFTRRKAEADFAQYALTAVGYRAVLRADDRPDGSIDYRVFANTNTLVGMAGNDRQPIIEMPSEDGKAYCFTVPSGFWVMRRGGNVVMTGNCGMIAHRTQFTLDDLSTVMDPEAGVLGHAPTLSRLREDIERRVPLSAGKYNRAIYDDRTEEALAKLDDYAIGAAAFAPEAYAQNWRHQLGTLGSGNHFIEISLDEEDRVWLFLHSGSRGVGNKIAQYHIKVAQDYCARHYIDLPDRDLAYLVEYTWEFEQYIAELRWAQAFALANREEMMRRVTNAFENWIEESVEVDLAVNCHHNYTEQERHFGQDVWLSRKGAINASEGTWGLIPGSMGTRSYVVQGKGNPVALNSAPHGAGREYSRSAARKAFTFDQLQEAMVGIEYRQTQAFIDEIPQAYKPIDVVMEDARDLVEVRHTLRQIVNVKGA